MSYTQSIYHVIFRTKGSLCCIHFSVERLLYHYIYSTSNNLGCHIYRIGGMPDHVHICVGLPSTLCIAKYVEYIKVATSKRFKHSQEMPDFIGWGKEYAAFSLRYNDVAGVTQYIMNQKDHHKNKAFKDEYKHLIESEGITIKQEYFLVD